MITQAIHEHMPHQRKEERIPHSQTTLSVSDGNRSKYAQCRTEQPRKPSQWWRFDPALRHVSNVRNQARGRIDLVKADALYRTALGSAVQYHLPSETGGFHSIVESLRGEGDPGETKIWRKFME